MGGFGKIVVALFVSVAAFAPAHANDSMAQLKTGGLVFVQTDAIEMSREDLSISPSKVHVEYRFHNKSDRDVETLVAFPMPDIVAGPDMSVAFDPDKGDNFLGFEVTQDGKPVKANLQQRVLVNGVDLTGKLTALNIPLVPQSAVSNNALSKLAPGTVEDLQKLGLVRVEEWNDGSGTKAHVEPQWTLRSVYWWNTVFPAGSDVVVRHSYNTSVGGTVDLTYLDENGRPQGERFDDYERRYCLDKSMIRIAQKSRENEKRGLGPLYYENWISYILMTGNNWAGPIGTFTVTIDKGSTKNLVSFCGEGVRKTGPTTFEMTKKDFFPERDLEILLLKRREP